MKDAIKGKFQANMDLVCQLIQLKEGENNIIQLYLGQNAAFLNEVFGISLEYLARIRDSESPDHAICLQNRYLSVINRKISELNRYVQQQLADQSISDDWLKKHCEMATD